MYILIKILMRHEESGIESVLRGIAASQIYMHAPDHAEGREKLHERSSYFEHHGVPKDAASILASYSLNAVVMDGLVDPYLKAYTFFARAHHVPALAAAFMTITAVNSSNPLNRALLECYREIPALSKRARAPKSHKKHVALVH